MTFALRSYQQEAIDTVFDYWSRGGGNPLVSMATGTGKALTIAGTIKQLHQMNPLIRVICLVHVKELVEQNFLTFQRYYPGASTGINCAQLNRRDKHQAVLFASINSIYKLKPNVLGKRDVILIDECHLCPKAGEGMYRTFLDNLRSASPDMRIVGFTATPYRMDSGRLDDGPGKIFDETIFEYGIRNGIEDGYLSPLTSKGTALQMDVRSVAKRGGEFVAGALEIAVDQDWITKAAVAEMVAFGEHRRAWLAFCAGVKHAEHVRDEVRAHGISCEMVTGETPNAERARIIRDYKAGKIRCLTNAQVLTTGFDAPQVDLVAMLRPTLSPGLYCQIVGRGTRLATGKDNCLVLDFAGNVRRHGPVDAIEVKPKFQSQGSKSADDEVRAKECPNCHELVAFNTRRCPSCDHEWPIVEVPKHDAEADALTPILSTEAPPWVPVEDVQFRVHNKPGSPPSLRVEYGSALNIYREWVAIEHQGFARRKAETWWQSNADGPCPITVAEALLRKNQIRWPTEIQVRKNGKYFDIIGRRAALAEEAA